MRETCRVRSRSTSAAGAVHVRVRAMAWRISADSGTPAAAALVRQSADSSGVRRTATMTGRRLAIGTRRHGGNGGAAPARAIHRRWGLLGFEGAESLASPAVIPRVGWLPATDGSGASAAGALEADAQGAGRTVVKDGVGATEAGHIGGLNSRSCRNPAGADGVEMKGSLFRSRILRSAVWRAGVRSRRPRRFHLRPYWSVKTTPEVDSHFGPPAIHTVAASHRRPWQRLSPPRGQAAGDRFAASAARQAERLAGAR